MENIILNIWIDMKNGLKVRLLEKPGSDDTSFLIMEIDDKGSLSKKALIVKTAKFLITPEKPWTSATPTR